MGIAAARGAFKRVDEYVGVMPDLVTVYLGWNRTIFKADPRKNGFLYRRLALYRFYYHLAVNRGVPASMNVQRQGKFFDPEDETLEHFRKYSFKHDIQDLHRIVKTISKRRPEAKIVLITLAGLLDWRDVPDEAALKKSYPLESSRSLDLYALLTQRFNEALRKYARKQNLVVVDLEKYALEEFSPRSAYFVDNVHPNAKGYVAMGRFLARELEPYIPCD